MLVSDKRPLPEISSCAALREGCLLSLVVGYRLKRSSAASNNYGSPWLKQLSVRGCRTPARYSRGNVAHISTSWTCPKRPDCLADDAVSCELVFRTKFPEAVLPPAARAVIAYKKSAKQPDAK